MKGHVFIDFEASALDGGFPIEVGWAVLPEDPTAPITSGGMLIRPPDEWLRGLTWSPDSEMVHGICLADLLAQGLAAGTVAARLHAVFGEAEVVWSDEGAMWDREWLDALFAASALAAPQVEVHDLDALIGSFDDRPFDQMRYAAAFSWMERQPKQHRAEADATLKAEFVRRYALGCASD